MRGFGVYSEVGKLRLVMVCRPGLAHQRLTPGNCHDLLFDDVVLGRATCPQTGRPRAHMRMHGQIDMDH